MRQPNSSQKSIDELKPVKFQIECCIGVSDFLQLRKKYLSYLFVKFKPKAYVLLVYVLVVLLVLVYALALHPLLEIHTRTWQK